MQLWGYAKFISALSNIYLLLAKVIGYAKYKIRLRDEEKIWRLITNHYGFEWLSKI